MELLKGLIRPVVVFVIGLGLGVLGSVLKFDVKKDVCGTQAITISK